MTKPERSPATYGLEAPKTYHRSNSLPLIMVGCLIGTFVWNPSIVAQQTVAERDDIRNRKIRRVTEWRYGYSDGRAAAEGRRWRYHEYDRHGNLIVTGRFTSDGRDSPMYVREYDSGNRPIRRTWYCGRTDTTPIGRPCLIFRDYRFDEWGNVAEENGSDLEGKFVARVTFRRDPAGRPIDRHDFFAANSPKNRRYQYKYNAHGDAVESVTSDGAGTVIEFKRIRHTYDANGRVVSTIVVNADGLTIGGAQHAYDELGNRVETVELDGHARPIRKKRFKYSLWNESTAQPAR